MFIGIADQSRAWEEIPMEKEGKSAGETRTAEIRELFAEFQQQFEQQIKKQIQEQMQQQFQDYIQPQIQEQIQQQFEQQFQSQFQRQDQQFQHKLEQPIQRQFQQIDQKLNYVVEQVSQTRIANYARSVWKLEIPDGAEPQGRDFDFDTADLDEKALESYEKDRLDMVAQIKSLIKDPESIKRAKFEKGAHGIEFNILGFASAPILPTPVGISRSIAASSQMIKTKLKSPVGAGGIETGSHFTFVKKIFDEKSLTPNCMIIAEVTTSQIAFNQTMLSSTTPAVYNVANSSTFALLSKIAQLERQVSFAMAAFNASINQIYAALVCPQNDSQSAKKAVESMFESQFQTCFPKLSTLYAENRFAIVTK